MQLIKLKLRYHSIHYSPDSNLFAYIMLITVAFYHLNRTEAAGTRIQIREIMNTGSVEALEELVLQGHGDRLLGETTGNPMVREFIKMVPIYMVRSYI